MKFDYVRSRQAEIELREDVLRLRVFDVTEPIAGELITRIDDYEVVGREAPPNVVDADGDEAFRLREFIQRLATTTDDDSLTLVRVEER